MPSPQPKGIKTTFIENIIGRFYKKNCDVKIKLKIRKFFQLIANGQSGPAVVRTVV